MMNRHKTEVDVRWKFDSLPKFADSKPRYAIGLCPDRDQLIASFVRVLGRGIDMVCDVLDERSIDLNDQLIDLIHQNMDCSTLRMDDLVQVKLEFAQLAAELIRPLLLLAKRSHDDVLLIGVHGMDGWYENRLGERAYEPLCNPTVLSETTGVTIVDDFSARDIVHGGVGGPTNTIADWVLLGERSGLPGTRNRAIVRLASPIRFSMTPSRNVRKLDGIAAFDLDPGLSILEELAVISEVTFARLVDSHFVAQGKTVAPFLNSLHENAPQPTKWSAVRTSNGFLQELVRQALVNHPLQDVVQTTMKFLAIHLASSIKKMPIESTPFAELIVCGPLQTNGTFLNHLQNAFPDKEITPLTSIIGNLQLDAAGAAIMGLSRLDQIIGNSYHVTGTKVPRCLGRMTPGNPKNWERIAMELYAQLPATLKLKEAI